jgi:DNA-3-methyladenine glycosylase
VSERAPDGPDGFGPLLDRGFLERPALEVAGDLLGRVLLDTRPDEGAADETVAVRLTEVEAYAGLDDPASHAFRGRTARTEVMFGPAGHLYVYFVYGMHWCANVVTGPDGHASAVLLRAGEVIGGQGTAAHRRPAARTDAALARGPAGLATTLGLTRAANRVDLLVPTARWQLRAGTPVPAAARSTGPRVGVSSAADVPWRCWESGAPSVSVYRSGTRRRPAG